MIERRIAVDKLVNIVEALRKHAFDNTRIGLDGKPYLDVARTVNNAIETKKNNDLVFGIYCQTGAINSVVLLTVVDDEPVGDFYVDYGFDPKDEGYIQVTAAQLSVIWNILYNAGVARK